MVLLSCFSLHFHKQCMFQQEVSVFACLCQCLMLSELWIPALLIEFKWVLANDD